MSTLKSNNEDMTINADGASSEIILQQNDTERMRIDSAGHVTMPYQPAFSAKLSTNQSNLATGGVTTILFNTEIFDQNADFNTGTYTFTAPVTGRYQLNVALQINDIDSANTEYIDLWIITSNRTYRSFFDPQQQLNADADYLNLNLSVLADMDTDDTAYVGVKPHSGAAQTDINADYSYFSGYLVC